MADTELTKEKQKSEIQKRVLESIIETGKIEGHAGIAGWVGASGEKKTFEWLPDIVERIQNGDESAQEAQREAYEKARKDIEKEQQEQRNRDGNEDTRKNMNDRHYWGLS